MKESGEQPKYYGIEDLDNPLRKEGVLFIRVEVGLGKPGYVGLPILRKSKGLRTMRIGSPFMIETDDGESTMVQDLCVWNPKQTQLTGVNINLQREELRYEDRMEIDNLLDAGWKLKPVEIYTIAYRPRTTPPGLKATKPAA